MKTIFIRLAIAIVFLNPVFPGPAAAGQHLTILYSNDVRGEIEPCG